MRQGIYVTSARLQANSGTGAVTASPRYEILEAEQDKQF